jgi:DNA-binding CsgD family transcriptional regulator/PAS domain-containing protein
MFLDQFDKLTGEIYEASRDGGLWPRVLLQVCELLGSPRGSFWIRSKQNGELTTSCVHGQSEEDQREYLDKWALQDPWLLRLDRFPREEGVFAPSHSVITDEELEATEVYQAYLSPRKLHYGGGAWIARGVDVESFLTVIRSKQSGPLTEYELAMGTRIAGHIRRSVQLLEERHLLSQGCTGIKICFEELPFAVAILNQDGKVVQSNGRFQKLAGKADGLALREGSVLLESGDVLMPERRTRSFAIRRRRRGTPYWATLRPIQAENWHPMGVVKLTAILEVRDPDRATSADSAQLETLFGLTPAEARFASMLASGLSVKQAAEQLGIAEQTGRTHLKRAMSKTGTRRQAELMSRIIALD